MFRKNADGSITVGMLPEEEEKPVETKAVEEKKPVKKTKKTKQQ